MEQTLFCLVIFFSFLSSVFSPRNNGLFYTDGIELSSEGVMPFTWSRRKLLILLYSPNTTQIPVSILFHCREILFGAQPFTLRMAFKMAEFHWGGCPLVPSKTSFVVVLFPPNCSAWTILAGVWLPLVQILSNNSCELGTKAEGCSFPQLGYYLHRQEGVRSLRSREGSQGSDL